MKAIVLAAGKGKRLKGITANTPKPMLKVNGEVILEHNLNWLRSNGITDININLHYLPSVIKNYFGDGSNLGVKISYFLEEAILGTAGAVENIAHKWNEPFLVVYGDNFYPVEFSLKDFVDFHKKHGGIATIGLYDNKTEIPKSGAVIINQDYVIQDFIEKPDLYSNKVVDNKRMLLIRKEGLINTGIYLFDSQIITYLPRGFSDFGKDIFPELIRKKKRMFGYLFRGQLIAVDTVELYDRMKK